MKKRGSNRRSMTAYGRAVHSSRLGRWTVDIHSVNRKGLDMHIQLPSNLLFLDPKIRKWVTQAADRGQITVRVTFESHQIQKPTPYLKQLKLQWDTVARALKLDTDCVNLPFLLERWNSQEVRVEEKILQGDLHKAWRIACQHWLVMKGAEAVVLVSDIQKRMELIKKGLQKIQKLQPLIKERYRKRLSERIKEMKLEVDEGRLLREAALLAEKAEIAEEITRLYSHLDQMEEYLCSKETSVGRTLDFLSQEMGREIGTLMAKAGDCEIAKLAVVIKSEVEKIREQVQNIE